jgi:hypothetical protein
MSDNRRHGPLEIWRWPFALAILISFGLTAALLGQGGFWWAMSWIALAVPLVVVGACIYRRRRPA